METITSSSVYSVKVYTFTTALTTKSAHLNLFHLLFQCGANKSFEFVNMLEHGRIQEKEYY